MIDPASHDDSTLVRLTLSGERSAFDELARRYQSALLRFTRRNVAGDAEDVVQETFVKAYQRLDQYRPAYAFKTWLFAIAYHETINHFRRQSVRATETLVESSTDNDPADLASAADDRSSLWALAKSVLSDTQFSAVWLFYVEEMSTREIARVQRRSLVSVKVMLHRARASLAKHLAAKSFPESLVPAHAGDL